LAFGVATLLAALVPPGRTTLGWDGAGAADGRLRAVVMATTSLGTRKQQQAFVRDTTRPVVKILAARRERHGTRVRLRVSERANLALRLGDTLVRFQAGPGVAEVWQRIAVSRVTVYSTDLAGNGGRPAYARVR